jgi:hypothetical protein
MSYASVHSSVSLPASESELAEWKPSSVQSGAGEGAVFGGEASKGMGSGPGWLRQCGVSGLILAAMALGMALVLWWNWPLVVELARFSEESGGPI